MPRKRRPERRTRTGRRGPFSVAVVHLGCAKNQVDSERLMGLLASEGFVLSGDVASADACLLTTCAFVRDAVEETERAVRELLSLGRGGRGPFLAVAGCLVDRFGAGELARRFPGVGLWFGGGEYTEIPERLAAALAGAAAGRERSGSKGAIPPEFERAPRFLSSPWYAYLKVAEGCSNRCNYCTIPSIRGGFRGIPKTALLEEARALAGMGVRELVLVAQDTAVYRDPETGAALPRLVEELSRIEDVRWIRLMYLHPAHLGDVAEVFSVSEKVLPYADVPIQHASDRVLERMGRGYASSDLRRLLERLREVRPGIVLRTTVMTGHPGEGAEEFDELLRFLEEERFAYAGVFAYSPEEGTPSAGMDGRPEAEEAARRREEALALQQGVTFGFLDSLVGREEEALPEGDAARGWFQAPEVDGVVEMVSGRLEDMGVLRLRGRTGYDMEGEVVS